MVRYASAEDLIIKTPGFYEYVARDAHRQEARRAPTATPRRISTAPNLYQSEIDRNMDFLRQAIETADLSQLRRLDLTSLSAGRRTAPQAAAANEPGEARFLSAQSSFAGLHQIDQHHDDAD